MDLGLNGKRAVVAASSRGLGRACAEALLAEGAVVAIGARDADQLTRTAAAIGAHAIPVDLAKPGEPAQFVRAAAQALGGIDIIVTNAGGPPAGAFMNHDALAWQRAFELNLVSVVELVRAALPYLKQSTAGRLVNLVSIAAKQPIAGLILSNAVRTAVLGLAKTLADELAPHGITVNNVCPGRIATDRVRALDETLAQTQGCSVEAVERDQQRAIPLGRYGRPHELAALVTFLCSDKASYMTGTTILVDGGAYRGLM